MNSNATLATPLVFNITRGSFSDGPGVRTTVFFKGCPLRCPWCHNPESQRYEAEIMHFPELCVGCFNCRNGKPCYTFARKEMGTYFPPEKLASEILKDTSYFATSGGGVTFSGGEALSFPEYLFQLAKLLKHANIHIAVQTSGFFNYHLFEKILLEYVDLIFFDFKIMDAQRHHDVLGQSNRVILENFQKLQRTGIHMVPRIPLIPNYIANKENLRAIAEFFRQHRVTGCEFLYYNPTAGDKLERLGRRRDPNLPDQPMPLEENQAWIRYFKAAWGDLNTPRKTPGF